MTILEALYLATEGLHSKHAKAYSMTEERMFSKALEVVYQLIEELEAKKEEKEK